MGNLYICNTCKSIQYFKTPQSSCFECNNSLLEAEDWEEFTCPICSMTYDANTLRIHGNLNRIPEGIIKCKYDENVLHP